MDMMRILLLSNQPERTTRLMMFKGTLESLGYYVIVPRFTTRSWLGVAGEAKRALQKEKPDVVHLFNVPDIIYHNLGKLKGTFFQKLIYDYRSPCGVELQMTFGPAAKPAGRAVSGANGELRGRFCDSQSRESDRGTGVDARGAEAAGVDSQREEDECPERP